MYLCRTSIMVKLEFGDVSFCGGRNLEKNPRSKVRTNSKLNPHMTPDRNQTRPTLEGGEGCTIPAPHKVAVKVSIW